MLCRDEDLGEYWGLVRIDVEGFSMGGHKNDPCSDHNGTVVVDPTKCSNGRRTGRFTTKDFEHFTHAVQAFNGSADYEIYTVQPFRLPSYRKGYYLATGMFFEAHEVQEIVECELLQSTDRESHRFATLVGSLAELVCVACRRPELGAGGAAAAFHPSRPGHDPTGRLHRPAGQRLRQP